MLCSYLKRVVCCLLVSPATLSQAYRPVPSPAAVGAFYTGTYRNVFIEAGYSESDVAAKVTSIWTQLFHGV
jgi:oligosaccharide reducing-end xylanase